jgi:hypothetical protein
VQIGNNVYLDSTGPIEPPAIAGEYYDVVSNSAKITANQMPLDGVYYDLPDRGALGAVAVIE